MNKQIEILIDKLYRYDRTLEPCYIGFPLAKGVAFDTEEFTLIDPVKNTILPTQIKVTSSYEDGSIRFVFIRFLADIPANKKCCFICEISAPDKVPASDNISATSDVSGTDDSKDFSTFDDIAKSLLSEMPYAPVTVTETSDGFEITVSLVPKKEF